MGKLKLEGEKASPGALRGTSNKTWREESAFPEYLLAKCETLSLMSVLNHCQALQAEQGLPSPISEVGRLRL